MYHIGHEGLREVPHNITPSFAGAMAALHHQSQVYRPAPSIGSWRSYLALDAVALPWESKCYGPSPLNHVMPGSMHLMNSEHAVGILARRHELARSTTQHLSSQLCLILTGAGAPAGSGSLWQSATSKQKSLSGLKLLLHTFFTGSSVQQLSVPMRSTWIWRALYSWCKSLRAWTALESTYVTAAWPKSLSFNKVVSLFSKRIQLMRKKMLQAAIFSRAFFKQWNRK